MKTRRRLHAAFALAACLPLTLVAAADAENPQESEAQQEAAVDTDPGRGNFFVEITDWIAQPTGLEYRVTTVGNPLDPFEAQVLSLDHDTESTFNYRAGFELPGDSSAIILSYLSQTENSQLEILTPGSFLFAEINTSGFLSGVNNDSLADGVSADSQTRLRDVRIDYYHTAFKGKRVSGKWFVGYRRVAHDRKLQSEYFPIAPNLPPIIPPVGSPRRDLVPSSDSALLSSNWEGRGLEAGLDIKVPLFRSKVWFESGLAVAVLRGKANTNYRSETHFYGLMNGDVIEEVLQPPYDEFSELDPMGVPFVSNVSQIAAQVGIQSQSESIDADIIETYLAIRWRFWTYAELVAGFRNTSYMRVGLDVRTNQVAPETGMVADEFKDDGTRILRLNPVTLERTEYSVDYEGFYFGLAFRF